MYVICWSGGGIVGKVWLGSKCLIEFMEAEVRVSKFARFDVGINRSRLSFMLQLLSLASLSGTRFQGARNLPYSI